jgi:secondary thiamine-phosphate synthase enzyme
MRFIERSFKVNTTRRNEFIDITQEVEKIIQFSTVEIGDVIVYCPHTTAAITLNENADPDVVHDLLHTLEKLIPHKDSSYLHGEGNSDAHLKSSLVGVSEQILIKDGAMQLGRWQGIYFCEFDGPRGRDVIVQVRGE